MPPTSGWMTSIPEASSVLSTDNVVEGMDFSAGPDNLEMCLECDLKNVMLVTEYLFHIKALHQSNYIAQIVFRCLSCKKKEFILESFHKSSLIL